MIYNHGIHYVYICTNMIIFMYAYTYIYGEINMTNEYKGRGRERRRADGRGLETRSGKVAGR